MSPNLGQGESSPRATLIDLMIVLVLCSAITIFAFWIATRLMRVDLFDQLPDWIIGTYGYFTALGTGSVGLGAAIIQSITRRGPRPDYVKLVGVCEAGIIFLIVAIILIDRFLVTPPAPKPLTKTFTHSDVSRFGTMSKIRVTVFDNFSLNQKNRYLIEYYWTGSGGTQNGSQNASLSFKGDNGATLQAVTFPIDRSHCYYGGGNYEKKEGEFQTTPSLIVGIGITLSEVVGRMGKC